MGWLLSCVAQIPSRWFDFAALGGIGFFVGLGVGQRGCFHWPPGWG